MTTLVVNMTTWVDKMTTLLVGSSEERMRKLQGRLDRHEQMKKVIIKSSVICSNKWTLEKMNKWKC